MMLPVTVLSLARCTLHYPHSRGRAHGLTTRPENTGLMLDASVHEVCSRLTLMTYGWFVVCTYHLCPWAVFAKSIAQ